MMLKKVIMIMMIMMVCEMFKKSGTLLFQRQLAPANVDEAPQQYFPT